MQPSILGMPRRAGMLQWLLVIVLQLLILPWAGAQQSVPVPKLTQYATDLTGTLTAQQLQELDSRLQQIDQGTGSQVVVLMIPTLGGQDIESFSLAVAEQNQIGRKKLSDGVLLLVVKNDRQVRVEVGYGLEGAIPDITAGRIIREYMGPKFRNNDYFGGINDAIGIIDKAIRGEQLPAPISRQGERSGSGDNWLFALVAAFIAAQVARGLLGRLPAGIRGIGSAAVGGGVAWLLSAVALVGGLGAVIGFVVGLISSGGGGGGRYVGHGGWGGIGGMGGGGRSSGGFGGGGGFSGGGGSFGGGGASGSW